VVDSKLASKLQRSKAGNDCGAIGGGAHGGALLCMENDQQAHGHATERRRDLAV
jgi:hypothetical protein